MSMKKASKGYQESLDNLITVYRDWLQHRRLAIRKLKKIVKDMDSDEFRSNLTSIVGSGAGVTGGTMMIGGLLLAPFTGGLSLVVAGVGAGVGIAGGLTNLTSDAIAKNFALKKCDEANTLIEHDQTKSLHLQKAEAKFTEAIVILKKEADATQTDILTILKATSATTLGLNVFKMARTTAGFVRAGYKGASAFGMAAGKALGKAGGAFAIVGIGLDIWTIVSSSTDISNGSKSELGKGISKYIVELEKLLKAVENHFSETYEFNF